ncbi:extracellular metallo proteinase mep [Aspergillus ambiguus]|uniref:extracellular metalloproteinase n=1 Tax=Aspergillus ambiguus TaxID=176160 RepID=UPI003CCCE80A
MRLTALAGALALPLCALAHPARRTKGIERRGIDLTPYRLPGASEYTSSWNSPGRSLIFERTEDEDYVESAKKVVQSVHPDAIFRVIDDHYVGDNGVSHVHLLQTAHGIDIDNANFNVNIDKNGKVLSYGNSFFKGDIPKSNPLTKKAYSDPLNALKVAVKKLNIPLTTDDVTANGLDGTESYIFKGTRGALSDPTADLVYLAKPDNTLALSWRVETDMNSNWLLTYVDAQTAEVIHGAVDYISDATYKVYPWGLNDPTEGAREIIEDPWDSETSEFTWIGDGDTKYKTTRGNNAIAQSNPDGGRDYLNNYRPESSSLKFVYPYPTSNASDPSSYIDASVTQLFYTANTYHDLLYTLGFNERSGNFEANNNGEGGKGDDYVILNAQDGSGTNNAMFGSPPDGKPGRMYMFLWTESNPPRDGSMEAGIVIHEYTHGLSSRLTGGPANARCVHGRESGGMGEGWSDFMATAVRLKPGDTRETDYTMGSWASNDPRGLRDFPYSTSMSKNPLTYLRISNMTTPHDIGTVWASMLYEVMWNMIDKHGKNDAPKPDFKDGVPTDGKYLSMKIVMDGMALQPCNPDFIQARDAILDADVALTDGDNQCEIWKGFAKRGLGAHAVQKHDLHINSFDVPKDVC